MSGTCWSGIVSVTIVTGEGHSVYNPLQGTMSISAPDIGFQRPEFVAETRDKIIRQNVAQLAKDQAEQVTYLLFVQALFSSSLNPTRASLEKLE